MNLLQKIEADYKAEVLAAQILANEQDLTKIIIERLGQIPRSHTKDVYNVKEDISQVSLDEYTIFESFRQSIYDAMPENVFHPSTLGGLGCSQEEIVEEIRNQRKKEAEARTFFKPFEQEAPYVEMLALVMELMYEQKGTYDNLRRLFEANWPIIRELPSEMALGFIYILPILNKVTGKMEWVAKCLSYLMNLPVRIEEKYEILNIPQKNAFVMGGAHLGIDSTFAGSHNDGQMSWDVFIGPIPTEQASEILPGSRFMRLLDMFLDYFAPAQVFVNKHLAVQPNKTTIISSEKEGARLGFTFNL